MSYCKLSGFHPQISLFMASFKMSAIVSSWQELMYTPIVQPVFAVNFFPCPDLTIKCDESTI